MSSDRKDKNLLIWDYSRLCVLGIYGGLENLLEKLPELCRKHPLEFSPIKKELYRDFLAAFHSKPPIDITITRGNRGDALIVSYSLDKDKSLDVIDGIMQASGFVSEKADAQFIKMIENEIWCVETITYKQCSKISEMSNASFDSVFGAVRYANFLKKYMGLSENMSMKKAAERFGLRLSQ